MSWIKENYEKAALGGAAAVLLGVVGVSVLGGSDELSSKQKNFSQNDSTAVVAHDDVAVTLKGRQSDAKVAENSVGPRKIDLFVGQALYMKDGGAKPVDLYESESVHEGIPNVFWQKYGIDPTFANAADRDFDKDGFSNREEFNADTDPTEVEEHPSPLAKLVGRSVDVLKMQMRWNAFDANSISLTYQDNKRQRVRGRVLSGAKFFVEGNDSIKERFVLGEKKTGVMGPKGSKTDAYVVTDTSPRFKGTDKETFLFYKNGAEKGNFNEIQDRSVKFTLNALGEESKSFTVFEKETFSLPFDAGSKDRPYKVESIVAKGAAGQFTVTVSETIDGKKKEQSFTVGKP